MNIFHPLTSIPEGSPTWRTFGVLVVLFLVFGTLAGPNLKAPGITHQRIIALERPADAKEARDIVAEWDKAGKLGGVRRSILWDNVFILVYSTLTALTCVIAARAFFHAGSTAYQVALAVAWLPWFAGALDYVENYAMWRMIGGFEGELLPQLAWWCATVKFAIILTLSAWGNSGALVAGVWALWPNSR